MKGEKRVANASESDVAAMVLESLDDMPIPRASARNSPGRGEYLDGEKSKGGRGREWFKVQPGQF